MSLDRFLEAQRRDYAIALDEIRSGRKRSHWMWYVFPQIAGLGSSEMSRRYAIRDAEEAAAYLAHPVLGARLVEITTVLLALDGRSAREIFGTPDDMKLRSCCTLFAQVSPQDSVFAKVIARYFSEGPDPSTLALLSGDRLSTEEKS